MPIFPRLYWLIIPFERLFLSTKARINSVVCFADDFCGICSWYIYTSIILNKSLSERTVASCRRNHIHLMVSAIAVYNLAEQVSCLVDRHNPSTKVRDNRWGSQIS